MAGFACMARSAFRAERGCGSKSVKSSLPFESLASNGTHMQQSEAAGCFGAFSGEKLAPSASGADGWVSSSSCVQHDFDFLNSQRGSHSYGCICQRCFQAAHQKTPAMSNRKSSFVWLVLCHSWAEETSRSQRGCNKSTTSACRVAALFAGPVLLARDMPEGVCGKIGTTTRLDASGGFCRSSRKPRHSLRLRAQSWMTNTDVQDFLQLARGSAGDELRTKPEIRQRSCRSGAGKAAKQLVQNYRAAT